MQFVDGLPTGEENVWWQIVTPVDQVREVLDGVMNGTELYLDLAIIRDGKYHALIRVLPDQLLGINRGGKYRSIYRIERAKGFFLDLDGTMTENLVGVRVVLSTLEADLSTGYVVMWPEEVDHIAHAS